MSNTDNSEESQLIKLQNNGNKENKGKSMPYPKMPQKNQNLRSNDKVMALSSNLINLKFSNQLQKVYIYSIEILPELDKNNFTLQNKIYKIIDPKLSKYFIKKTFAGYNLFGSTTNPIEQILIEETVENVIYKITFKKVSELDFEEISDTEGINQKKKHFIEKLIKDILLSAKDTMKFGTDRMIIQMNKENAIKGNDNSTIYKGFYTAAQITTSGLYLLVLNMNKYISGKTLYEKILQIKDENRRESEREINQLIEEYIEDHKTVLTTYGSLRAYRIEKIEFDKTPLNTNFNFRTPEGMKTINIYNYYKQQYKIDIKDKNQPLLIAERKINGRHLLPNEENDNPNNKVIYLVPELVLITGIEDDKGSKSRRQDIIAKTKTNPNQRMNEINKIHDLMNNDNPKQYKKNGTVIRNKSSKELAKDWGINLGDNISLKGRILNQPILIFKKNKEVIPRNGLFRTDATYDGVTIYRNDIMYIYSRKDRADFRNIINNLFGKADMKGIKMNFSPKDFSSYGIDKPFKWDDIKSELDRVHFSKDLKMVIAFCDNNLQRYYVKLKEYFTNIIKVDSQFIETRRLMNQKTAGSIMFNIVEQINIKMGGINFYIDFNNIIDKNKIYLIIGLEAKRAGKELIDYVLTYTYNNKLSRTHTVPRTCKDNKESKEQTLNELINEALRGLRETGKAPHPPNYIIIYRQGGNHVQNLKLLQEEVPIFVNYINNKKEKSEKYKDTKLTYICCNLKGDLKFFEENNNANSNSRYDNHKYNNNYNNNKSETGNGNKNYQNPSSGLCVDEKVIQKNKYEFYIQPQYVNQGTATPCHYEVLYQDYDENNPESNLSLEQLQNLTFQLSFYYWTWSGAVRVPGVLRLSTTALDYYSRCLNHKLNLKGEIFRTPGFI